METIQITFGDGSIGRLAQEQPGGPVVCEGADGSVKTSEEAGTVYVLQVAGDPEPPQIGGARTAGYTLEVQYGDEVVLPPPPEPPVEPPLARRGQTPDPVPDEPDPAPRRRSSS